MNIIQCLPGALHLFQDVVGGRGPDEWLRLAIVTVYVIVYGVDQLFQIAEYSAVAAPVSEEARLFALVLA